MKCWNFSKYLKIIMFKKPTQSTLMQQAVLVDNYMRFSQQYKLFIRRRRRLFQSYRTNVSNSQKLAYDRATGIVSDSITDTAFFRSVIGLEIHAQLMIPTKLFSSAPTKHYHTFFPSSSTSNASTYNINSPPNSMISPFDIAYPGTLPLLSQAAVKAAAKTAHALQCTIAPWSRFERKHYHYADLPLGYQVTQQRWPIATRGQLTCRHWSQNINAEELQRNANKNKSSHDKVRRRGQRHVDTENTSAMHSTVESKQENNVKHIPSYFTAYIDRIQLEQDTGKTTMSTQSVSSTEKYTSSIDTYSFIDFNRAGCALVEIVFMPSLSSAYEAASVVSTLQSLLRFIGTCDGKMESGSLRCDLNISIAPIDTCFTSDKSNPWALKLPLHTGHRVEVKNLNSIRQIILAAEYEAIRQAHQRLNNSPTNRETRTWDPKRHCTVKLREKGDAVDYRFMPEPDLPPVVFNEDMLDGMSLDSFLLQSVPELPMQAAKRLVEQYNLSEDVAILISSDRSTLSFYEDSVQCVQSQMTPEELPDVVHRVPKVVANWLINDVYAEIKAKTKRGIDNQEEEESPHESIVSMEQSPVNFSRFSSLLVLLIRGSISSTQAKKILGIMFNQDLESDAATIAHRSGWRLIQNMDELETLCRQVILDQNLANQLDQYRKGGQNVRKITKFYLGQIMALSKGNAHPELLQKALENVLENI